MLSLIKKWTQHVVRHNMSHSSEVDTSKLRKLKSDLSEVDSSVHADVIRHIDESILSYNDNGAFFDMRDLKQEQYDEIRRVVDYAVSTKRDLEQRDRLLGENVKRLSTRQLQSISGVEDQTTSRILQLPESYCKQPRGVFLKK